jgi:predicted patatin/cPLA2 family phospholipase
MTPPSPASGGLVLEGGGLRGNYTAGVLDAFLDEGIVFPYVIGVSAGCGMGCSYLSKQRGRNLEILKKYRRDPRYCSFRNFFRTGSLFGLDFIYGDLPERLVPFDFNAFYRSPARFVTVCTDCGSGLPVYYEKVPDQMTVLKASAAMPYVSKMVEYEGRRLLDGAITDPLPLDKAVEAGYRENVAVLTQPRGYRKNEPYQPPARIWYSRWPNLVRALEQRVENYNRSLKHIEAEERAGRVLVICPSRNLHISRTEKSVEKLIRLYELGIADAKAALNAFRS